MINSFLVPAQRVEFACDSKRYSKLIMDALTAEAECAAYREALKNVMRSKAALRVGVARKALFGKNTKQRGKELLKVVKAAVQFCQVLRGGDQKEQMGKLRNLEAAYLRFKAKGATARGWLKKGLKYGT